MEAAILLVPQCKLMEIQGIVGHPFGPHTQIAHEAKIKIPDNIPVKFNGQVIGNAEIYRRFGKIEANIAIADRHTAVISRLMEVKA